MVILNIRALFVCGTNLHVSRRARSDHWVKKEWPERITLTVNECNVINEPLVPREKIILPPLHIKLGTMKQCVKALPVHGNCFNYICRVFPGMSNEKLKAGIFDGPQIRKLMNDPNFTASMTEKEFAAWISFTVVVKNFLGNNKASNYIQIVEDILSKFQSLGAKMSIKIHYLFSPLDQRFSTSGPRPTGGPPNSFRWAAKRKIFVITSIF